LCAGASQTGCRPPALGHRPRPASDRHRYKVLKKRRSVPKEQVIRVRAKSRRSTRPRCSSHRGLFLCAVPAEPGTHRPALPRVAMTWSSPATGFLRVLRKTHHAKRWNVGVFLFGGGEWENAQRPRRPHDRGTCIPLGNIQSAPTGQACHTPLRKAHPHAPPARSALCGRCAKNKKSPLTNQEAFSIWGG